MKVKTSVIEADNVQIKIYIEQKKKKYTSAKAVIRIDEDVYDELVALSNATKLTICDLASEMIRFAKERTAIIEKTVVLDKDHNKDNVNKTTPQEN